MRGAFCFQHTVTGANHVASGQVNQDRKFVDRADDDTVILAVADGHGSKRYVRSHIGAQLAGEVFVELAKEFVAGTGDGPAGAMKNAAEFTLPRMLETRWKQRVAAHLGENPLGVEASHIGADMDPAMTYGTTLVGAVVHRGVLVAWQIGDGDLVLISPEGDVTEPLAPEKPVLGVETESLCQTDAWNLVRVHWRRLAVEPVALVIACTDGLANSFAGPDGFRDFARGMLQRIQDVGAETVDKQVPSWLEQATSFSGDDVSLVAVLLEPGSEPPAADG